jgi:hypothetical protein
VPVASWKLGPDPPNGTEYELRVSSPEKVRHNHTKIIYEIPAE